MKNLKKIIYLLSPQEIKQAILLLIMIVIMAFVEMIGITSIMPFIGILSNPDVVETNFYLNLIFQSLNIKL
jgi:ATP-binding cassette, subfamily B, bacterial PglK